MMRSFKCLILATVILAVGSALPLVAQVSKKKAKDAYDLRLTTFFIRGPDGRSIVMTMLLGYSSLLEKRAQALTKQRVHPIIFSVSTLPSKTVSFRPDSLIFEQGRYKWSPDPEAGDVFPLFGDIEFKKEVSGEDVVQGIIFLPFWFDPHKPFKLIYGKSQGKISFFQKVS